MDTPPNPFDQFDAPAAAPNPFDQFDASAQSQGQSAPASPMLQSAPVVRTASGIPILPNPYQVGPGEENTRAGIGKLYTDKMLGAKQRYAQTTGGDPNAVIDPVSGLNAQDKRALDQPLAQSSGGQTGALIGALPFSFLPGANSYAGAGIVGGGFGAAEPTVGDESTLANTAVGAGGAMAGKKVGDVLSSWLTKRAAEPLIGWGQTTGNKAAAEYVGSEADALKQPAIAQRSKEFGQIFGQARSPDVTVPIPPQTSQIMSDAEAGIPGEAKQKFWGNPQINDLMTHLQSGDATAQELGTISSRLNTASSGELSSRNGNRELGLALKDVQEHVDDLVGNSITDPVLKAAYDTARPEYRMFMTMIKRPTILNSSTGDVNLRNLGNYLQRYDSGGFMGVGRNASLNTSDLYNAARSGQTTALGSRPSPPILQPFKFLSYHAANSPTVQAGLGALSRVGAPIAPAIPYGLESLGFAAPDFWRSGQ
jgi:hypothetical protein